MPTPSASPDRGSRDPGRIVAVVVTFNRLPLLRRLLATLRTTTQLAGIVVVDNASTDGTGDWLAGLDTAAEEGAVPVRALTLPTNTGGAGGFAEGMRQGLELDADLLWLMDDDGVPEADCLPLLLEHVGEFDFWGPAVIAEDDAERLVFPIRLPGRADVVRRMPQVEAAAVDGLIHDIVIPFNGVLVTRELIEQIGVVRAEFFIWGDDHEFRLRAEKAGARIATVVDSHFRHPVVGDLGTPMMFGRTTYNHTPSDLKHYCMARNNTVNLRTYRGWPAVLAFVVKTLWFYLVTRRDPGRIGLSARGIVAGLRGDFSGHRRFLG